jgi:allantoin racemase
MRLLWQSFFRRTRRAKGMQPPDRDFDPLTEFRCALRAVNNALAAEQQGYGGVVMSDG